MGYKIAVVGATGNVGQEMLNTLHYREFPADEVFAVASDASIGKEVSYGEDDTLKVAGISNFDFSKVDLALFSAGGRVSEQYGPKAAEAGAIVIDNTAHFRMDPEVPLVVPEVNSHALADYRNRNIIANPNCSTIQMVVALKQLHDIAPIRRVVVATYQSVSGAGRDAMEELFNQTRGIFVNQPVEHHHFPKQIAFNVLPHIDDFMEDGFTKEEWKMREETKKILDPSIEVVATCVRVPVFVGHAEAVHVEFDAPIDEEQAREALRASEAISVIDHRMDQGYVTPEECTGDDLVFISRLRVDPSVPYGLAFWCVADNLKKGAALNSVQIAEELIQNYL